MLGELYTVVDLLSRSPSSMPPCKYWGPLQCYRSFPKNLLMRTLWWLEIVRQYRVSISSRERVQQVVVVVVIVVVGGPNEAEEELSKVHKIWNRVSFYKIHLYTCSMLEIRYLSKSQLLSMLVYLLHPNAHNKTTKADPQYFWDRRRLWWVGD